MAACSVGEQELLKVDESEVSKKQQVKHRASQK